MCEFMSWVEKGNKVYFLTDKQIHETAKGKELQEWSKSSDDLPGHGAIRYFYGLEQEEGINKECTDFSSPTNFPARIAKAIKGGKMRGLGTARGLLTNKVDAKWRSELNAVDAKWQPEQNAVYVKWRAEQDAVDAKWEAEQNAVDAKWRAELNAVNAKWRAELNAVNAKWRAERNEVDAKWRSEHNAVNAKFWDLFSVLENRNPAWR